jgi:hypothetical protein
VILSAFYCQVLNSLTWRRSVPPYSSRTENCACELSTRAVTRWNAKVPLRAYCRIVNAFTLRRALADTSPHRKVSRRTGVFS